MKYTVKLRHQWESYQEVEVEAKDEDEALELALEMGDPALYDTEDESGIQHVDFDYWDHYES